MSRAENCDGSCPFEARIKKKEQELVLAKDCLESASDSALADPEAEDYLFENGFKTLEKVNSFVKRLPPDCQCCFRQRLDKSDLGNS